jgi:predicted Rossmann fold flavoprotein
MPQPLLGDSPAVIIGGGAAGFFAAIQLADHLPGQRIIILEKSNQVLTKVRISGGGRCNVTHACFDPVPLASHYPRGQKELVGPFHRWQASDTVQWFQSRGVELKTEADGRMFPTTDRSETIASCLEQEARQQGIEVHTRREVIHLEPTGDGSWEVGIAGGDSQRARACLWAAGGMRSNLVIDLMRTLGHEIVPPVPSLFTFQIKDPLLDGLQGVSLEEAKASLPWLNLVCEGPILITHWGLSGPAILRLSSWGAREIHEQQGSFDCEINWIPKIRQPQEALMQHARKQAKKQLATAIPFDFPKRLWARMLQRCGLCPEQPWGQVSRKAQTDLIQSLTQCRLSVHGKSRNKEEFVTCGGVDLREVDFRTMESRKAPGLYFAGEALHIDAETGGFNFQAAWTTGTLAGRAMAAGLSR